MKRIQPSERVREEMQRLLRDGEEREGEPVTEFLLKSIRLLAQEALEAEQRDFLGRDHYERQSDDSDHGGHRNGYRTRHIDTAEGRVPIEVPQVRGTDQPYRSRLAAFLTGNSDVLEMLATEMYARGLSTRDIEDAFREVTGEQLLSRTAVSEVTDRLWEDYQAFCERDLSDIDVEYLFLDAVYEGMRPEGTEKEGILVAWAITRDGDKLLIHLALGSRESTAAWRDFLRDMTARGLQIPLLVVTDGAPGAIAAVEEMWPRSLRQRCLAHKRRNVLNKVPTDAQPEVKAAIRASYEAPTREVAYTLREDVNERFGDRFPSAIKSFNADFDACVAHLRCPAVHHRRIRTTNVAERAIQEERRRTKVIPRFFSEKACLKLAFGALIRASRRWRGVRMTDIELQQLRQLRRELGLLPDPPDEDIRPDPQRSRAA